MTILERALEYRQRQLKITGAEFILKEQKQKAQKGARYGSKHESFSTTIRRAR